MANEQHDLKRLFTQKKKLSEEIEILSENTKSAQKLLSKARADLASVNSNIESMKEKDVIVTEHAILRFLERKFKLDLEEIKSEILSENIKAQHKVLGNGKYPIKEVEGLRAVIKDNMVVTVS